MRAWGTEGSAPGQLSWSSGIDVASDGTVFVLDSGNSRVQRFETDGTFISAWGTPARAPGSSPARTASTSRRAAPSSSQTRVTIGSSAFGVDVSMPCAPAEGRGISYRVGGSSVTADVIGGTYLTPDLEPEEAALIRLRVSIGSDASFERTRCGIHASAAGAGVDTVRAVVRVR